MDRGPAPTVRDRIIEAAEICIYRNGISRMRMQDVADQAGVSMATLYRHVAGKEGLLLGVLVAEAEKLLVRLESVVAMEDDPADALVNGVLALVTETQKNDILMALLAPDAFGLTLSAPGAIATAVAEGAKFVEPLLARTPARRRRPDVTPNEASEWVTRIVQSMLTMPDFESRDEAGWRSYLQRMLVPALFVTSRPRRPAP